MSDFMWVCNRENGSRSELFGRKCWVADSLVSLIHSHLDYLLEVDPDHLAERLARYCEELRVSNGLRDPGVLTAEERAKIEPRLIEIAEEEGRS